MSTNFLTPPVAFTCTHRARHTLAVGAVMLPAIVALTGLLSLAAYAAVAALTGETPDPYVFTLSVLVAGPLATAAAAAPAAFALIFGVLARTAIWRAGEDLPLNCAATYRSQFARLLAAALLSIPTIGLSWLYFGPLLLARTLETAAPAPGASFRYRGSRTRLFVIATAAAIIVTGVNVVLQNMLIPAHTPFNPDAFNDAPQSADIGPHAPPLGTIATMGILLVFATAATLGATWYLARHVLSGMRLTFADSEPDLLLVAAPDMIGHIRYVLFWMILVLSTLGLALPFAYSSTLKRVLNSTTAVATQSPAT